MAWRKNTVSVERGGKFRVGMKVRIRDSALSEEMMIPAMLVRDKKIKNVFTIDEIFVESFLPQNIWLCLKECCVAGKGCNAHPAKDFEHISFIFR